MDRRVHICKESESGRGVFPGEIQDAVPEKWRGCQAGKNNKIHYCGNGLTSAECKRTHLSSFVSYLKMTQVLGVDSH